MKLIYNHNSQPAEIGDEVYIPRLEEYALIHSVSPPSSGGSNLANSVRVEYDDGIKEWFTPSELGLRWVEEPSKEVKRLIVAAAEAQQSFSLDELEAYAAAHRAAPSIRL